MGLQQKLYSIYSWFLNRRNHEYEELRALPRSSKSQRLARARKGAIERLRAAAKKKGARLDLQDYSDHQILLIEVRELIEYFSGLTEALEKLQEYESWSDADWQAESVNALSKNQEAYSLVKAGKEQELAECRADLEQLELWNLSDPGKFEHEVMDHAIDEAHKDIARLEREIEELPQMFVLTPVDVAELKSSYINGALKEAKRQLSIIKSPSRFDNRRKWSRLNAFTSEDYPL